MPNIAWIYIAEAGLRGGRGAQGKQAALTWFQSFCLPHTSLPMKALRTDKGLGGPAVEAGTDLVPELGK